jgi:hypothetical protein
VIASLEELPEKYRRHDFIAQRDSMRWTYFEREQGSAGEEGLRRERHSQVHRREGARGVKALLKTMAEASADEELDDLVPESIAGKVLQRLRAKGMKDAHPALTGEPIVRDGPTKEENKEPVITTAQLMRRAYFPAKRTG